MSGAYQAEVPLAYEKEYDDFTIRLEGRADGIITGDQGFTIDEIKGIYRDVACWQSLCRYIWLRQSATP